MSGVFGTPRSVLLLWVTVCALICGPEPARGATKDDARNDDATASDKAAEAHIRFRRGVERYDEGEYAAAAEELERSYELQPSYAVLYPMAQAYARLEKYARAVERLESYLTTAGHRIPDKRRKQTEKQLEELRKHTAYLTIDASIEGAQVTLDGDAIGKTPLSGGQLVDVGKRRIVVTKTGWKKYAETIELRPQQDARIKVVLEKAEPADAKSDGAQRDDVPVWAAWITAGGLAAGAAGMGIATWSATRFTNDLRDSPAATEGEIGQAETRVLALTITTGVLSGLAVASAGIALYFTLRSGGDDVDRPASLQIYAAPRGMGIRGAF